MRRCELLILGLVLVIAGSLRFLKLGDFPPALNWDEVSHGYNAYSVLLTGKDEWGESFPLFNFRAYGDYPLPLSLYLMIPFILVGGLSETVVRLPHALAGVVTVGAVYFLAKGLARSWSMAVLAAVLAAVGPWYVFPSRFATQPNFSVMLVVLAMAVFFNRGKKLWGWILTVGCLILSLFAYHTARVFSPLLLAAILWFYRDEWLGWWKGRQKEVMVFVGLVVVFLGLWGAAVVNPAGRARFQWVFLVDEGAVSQIIEARERSGLPAILARILYNRPVYFVEHFVANYVGYFSPRFLFFEGGTNYQFSLPGRGLLYPINLVGFYVGLVVVVWRALKGEKSWRLVLCWLVVSPVAASMTREAYAVLRVSTMLPLPEVLSSLGAVTIWGWLGRRKWGVAKWLVAGVYVFGLSVSAYEYFKVLAVKYPREYDWSWQYGYRQAVDAMKTNYGGMDKIFMTKKYGEPHEFVLFFWPWDPEAYRNDKNLVRYFRDGWYWVDSFDKFNFINEWEIKEKVSCGDRERCLLVTSSGDYPKDVGWRKTGMVNYLSGKPVFEIMEK